MYSLFMNFYIFSFSDLFVLFCSIKLRTIILQRGLADRSPAVSKECIKLMKDEWLIKCCNGDPVELLKYLDVETYELVGNAVMEALLKAGLVNLNDGESIRQYVSSKVDGMEGWLSFVVFLLN